jgi:hypothetical protein
MNNYKAQVQVSHQDFEEIIISADNMLDAEVQAENWQKQFKYPYGLTVTLKEEEYYFECIAKVYYRLKNHDVSIIGCAYFDLCILRMREFEDAARHTFEEEINRDNDCEILDIIYKEIT